MADNKAADALTRSLYPVAIALCLFPLADMVGRLLPPHLNNVQWRFGALGLLFGGTLVMLVLGLALLSFVASANKHAKVLYTVNVVAIALAVLVAAGLIVFALDAVQLRSTIREELKSSMATAAASAALSACLTVVAFGSLAVATIRARRIVRSEARVAERTPAIVMS
jgi:hypothetical protein